MTLFFEAWRMAHGAWSTRQEVAMRSALCTLQTAPEVLP